MSYPDDLRRAVDEYLETLHFSDLEDITGLDEAMRYSLLAGGKRDEALALYASLSAPDVPKAARLAAMHGIISAETAIGRPR